MRPQKDNAARFDDLAHQRRPSLAAEFWYFLCHNKKWWLLPILVTLLLLCLLVLVGGAGLAPFLYPVF